MNWEKPQLDAKQVRDLARTCQVSPLTASILLRRGYTTEEALRYIFEDELHFLHNPFLFKQMERVIERLHVACQQEESVLVFGDRDADGITATVLMVEQLQKIGLADVRWQLPMGDEPYGLSVQSVTDFAGSGGSLIITVDCGSTNLPALKQAAQAGIDVIIVDHHNISETPPPAYAIINPKLPDSGYPFPGLCTCALVFKLCWALHYSYSQFYNNTLCLMNARPANDVVVFDMVKLRNGVPTERLSKQIVPGLLSIEASGIVKFTEGLQIVAYDSQLLQRMFNTAFGNTITLEAFDLADETARLFPPLSNKSLLQLAIESRQRRYRDTPPEEIDVLVLLCSLYQLHAIETLLPHIEAMLDLVAMGTIADIMPLQNENRILVRRGLRRIEQHPRPALRELLRNSKLVGTKLTAREISFRLTPIINATGRLGQPDLAANLLQSQAPEEIVALSEKVIKCNQKRHRLSDAAWKRLIPQARASCQQNGGKFVFINDSKIPRGITGILASRISTTLNAPTAVVAEIDELAIASIRSVRGFVATDFLRQLDGLLLDWGGHDAAAGFSIARKRLPELTKRIEALIPDVQLDTDRQPLIIDAELTADYLRPDRGLADMITLFEPYGNGNKPLMFLLRNIPLTKVDIFGRKDDHLRMNIKAGEFIWPVIYWNAAARLGVDFAADDRVDLLFSLERNYFNGSETMQLIITDMCRAQSQ